MSCSFKNVKRRSITKSPDPFPFAFNPQLREKKSKVLVTASFVLAFPSEIY
jgi:hypothetical protein